MISLVTIDWRFHRCDGSDGWDTVVIRGRQQFIDVHAGGMSVVRAGALLPVCLLQFVAGDSRTCFTRAMLALVSPSPGHCPSGDDPITERVDETNCTNLASGLPGNLCQVDCSNR